MNPSEKPELRIERGLDGDFEKNLAKAVEIFKDGIGADGVLVIAQMKDGSTAALIDANGPALVAILNNMQKIHNQIHTEAAKATKDAAKKYERPE